MSMISQVRARLNDVKTSAIRQPLPDSDLGRANVTTSNFFLHIHSAKVHRHALKVSYTLGLGLISFFLFVILSVTGVLLMFYYVPSTTQAYDRMLDLRGSVAFGTFIRNMHRWAAHGMVGAVLLHMGRVFYTGAYRKPREFNWVIGVGLLLMTLFASFTGYLLPWDQLAFWAITVGTAIASYAPLLGAKLRFILLGDTLVGQEALLRFYVLHVAVLPLAITTLVSVHFWRIRKDGGLARPEEEDALLQLELAPELPDGRPYGLMGFVRGPFTKVGNVPDKSVFSWPDLFMSELFVFVLTLAGIMVVSLLFNAPLEEPVNVLHPPNPAKAPWYFLGLQEMVSYSAFWGGIGIPSVEVLLLLLVPYIDRGTAGTGRWFARERLLANTLFLTFSIINIILMVIGIFFRGPNWEFVTPW